MGLVALAAAGIALAGALREPARQRDRAEVRQRAEDRERLVRRLRAEQRPRYARSRLVAPAGASDDRRLAARAGLLAEVEATILADARRRDELGQIDGPFVRADCEPFPRALTGAGAERDLARRTGRYSCVAVSAEFETTEENVGGILGQTYRTQVDFRTGRFAYCKVAGQAGPTRDPLAATPRPCGG